MSNQFGPYRLKGLIGKSGLSEVYLAVDARDQNQTPIALKLLSAQARSDPELTRRFRLECLLVKRIRHPNVLPVYGCSEINGTPYVAMRYVDGTNLSSMIKEGPLSPERAVALLEQVAAALDAAHLKKLHHRDIKPSKILLEKAGSQADTYHAWLSGWGTARPIDISGAPTRQQVVGTPGYAAPEQLKNGIAPDHRADVYSLAVVLYECLSGRRPFVGDDKIVLTAQVTHEAPPLPRHLPEELRTVVAKGLAMDPGRRYQSAGEFAAAARAALPEPHQKPAPPVTTTIGRERPRVATAQPDRGRRPPVATILAGAAGVLAALVLYLTGRVDGPTLAWIGPTLAAAGVFLAVGVSGWHQKPESARPGTTPNGPASP